MLKRKLYTPLGNDAGREWNTANPAVVVSMTNDGGRNGFAMDVDPTVLVKFVNKWIEILPFTTVGGINFKTFILSSEEYNS
mmetsp:Transcript_23758/g.34843  ORF Transcript_23758/g.34843 Transcript_23758/m.34843 type:complete len:81 (+) Transcript_23758:665-907(+)